METKANYVRVGALTLVVIALFFGFFYWAVFSSKGDDRVALLVRIEGSVTGLQQGSQVLFNGLPVGGVRSLRIDPNNPRVVIATTEIDPTVPIKESTQANIGFQGLTGVAFIELRGGIADQPDILALAEEQGTVPVIRANPSDVTDILATARNIAERADNILGQFEGLVGAVGPSVRTTAENVARTSENVEVFTTSLAENSDNIRSFVASLGQLSVTANNVAQGLPATVAQAQRILEAVDPAAVGTTVANVRAVSQTVREQADKISGIVDSVRTAANGVGAVGDAVQRNAAGIDSFLGNLGPLSESADALVKSIDTQAVNETVASVREVANAVRAKTPQIQSIIEGTDTTIATLKSTLDGFTQTRAQFDTLLASVDPGKVNRAVENVSAATDNVAKAADSISNIATDIGARREDIDQIITNAELTSQRLASASQRIDSVVTSVNSFLGGSGDGTTLGTDASTTLRAVRDAARSIQSQIGPIAASLNRFSSQGLREVQGLIQNVNRTVDTINGAVTDFSANPSRLIYGGESGQVKTFDGRTRR
ncbi:MlaD family protein [Aurantimonas sp. Leaf443]|uniref:MlaD family protein n=1 Tax=Aurantimonas sp. Leaf443 TaxID=1736378 RepID=UPI0006FAEC0F|nr:MlaD family protein [Aurantimonas sp. Leaf443]KQT86226.1 hypothetical protein ASG48_06570 [Aurantimonas sp. Leaf443]